MFSREAMTASTRSAVRWLTRVWQDLLIVAALVALFLYAQRFPDGLDAGGDAVSKWQFVRQWSWDNDFRHAKWDHHMTRMGVNVVAWLAQKLCGPGWRTYYVAPLFMGAAQLPLVYALGRRVSGRLCGFLAALVVIYLPAVHTSVSQLLPDGFVGTYALLATYLLVRTEGARGNRQIALLIASALAAFAGYLAKETFVFFYPGLGVAAWLLRRRFRDAFVFAGVQVLGLGLETASYSLFTDYRDRLTIARSVHFAGARATPPSKVTLQGLFAIFRGLDPYWHYLLLAGAVGALGLLFLNRRARRTGQACVLIALSHVTLLGVSAQLWQNPLPRYMDPVIPFFALGGAYLAATCVQGMFALPMRVPPLAAWWSAQSARVVPSQLSVFVILAMICGLGWWTHRHQKTTRPFDGRAHGELLAGLANRTYERNLPLSHKSKRAKTLVAFYDVYLDVPRLVRRGVLPSFEDVRQRSREYTYLVKDPSVYDRKVFNALKSAGCVLELRNLKRRRIRNCADAARHTDLPAHCDGLLRELTSAPR